MNELEKREKYIEDFFKQTVFSKMRLEDFDYGEIIEFDIEPNKKSIRILGTDEKDKFDKDFDKLLSESNKIGDFVYQALKGMPNFYKNIARSSIEYFYLKNGTIQLFYKWFWLMTPEEQKEFIQKYPIQTEGERIEINNVAPVPLDLDDPEKVEEKYWAKMEKESESENFECA
ncbi:MAG: hypothetical protein IKO41_16085 [Lachnospiraceae bacterium]|nr:hypothetical protein [Lachnospiraceae bacterium]